MGGRFVRVGETGRDRVTLSVDGRDIDALEGDTLLVAMLAAGLRLRVSEFGDGDRAGFCLMGACQDCWVWTTDGQRLQACTTTVCSGMSVSTTGPGPAWSIAG
jgi:NADH dehydrogenase/NADH:ubiquinone oxidoreductase subunit G